MHSANKAPTVGRTRSKEESETAACSGVGLRVIFATVFRYEKSKFTCFLHLHLGKALLEQQHWLPRQ